MIRRPPPFLLRPAMLRLLLALPAAAIAQQAPITGRMMQATAPAASASSQTPSIPPQAPVPTTAAPAAREPASEPVDAPAAGSSPAPTATDVAQTGDDTPGAVTRQLLGLQVDGSRAGRRLPVLGDEASASYQRYLKSFEHPIPEFYETTVGKEGSGDSGH